ncbi:hypothetical protein BKA66DRAFT_443219 [Pyrenochaeta sp. MPI-SDFR-AT-0127]|nr:hypothetical protein BKA66DRAFT_443219 [Pyrenochaeta sp. MPI-SDFR-AT-0127]
MPRLGSKKSRSGCTQCKARRVKCDENRPCGACTRYRVECSLLRAHGRIPESVSPQSQREASSTVRTPSDSGPSPLPDSSDTSLIHDYESPSVPTEISSSQWMYDLELMHHFTAHAYLTLPGIEYTKQIWGYAVPQEAFKFPFLMHSILAFSANHLTYINPSKANHFRILSSMHQSAAVTSLNKALADLGPVNCHAIFVSASLTVMSAFADARIFDLDVLVETFQLLRGMDYVLDKTTPMIKKGPFAAIIRPTVDPPKPCPLLYTFLVDIQGSCTAITEESTSREIAIINATEVLRQALQCSLETSPHPAMRAAMMWPIGISAEFIEMLKKRTDPDVRALFKQYCKLLELAGTDFWWFIGWRGISQQV